MSIKDNVLERLLESEEYISGQELAESLNVSRNAVWKAVKSLENSGYLIDAVNNKGYKLTNKYSILSENVIKNHLKTSSYGKNIVILNEVDSTNNYAKNLALNNAEDGTVVISDYQFAGKGRMGRMFFSPKGTGLYVSVITRPDISILSAQLITSCTAVAVAKTLENLCGQDIKIKWVNDLFLNERKICGILTEASMRFEEKKLDYAVIGIGINIRTSESLPDELKPVITSIEEETGIIIDRNILCSELLNNLEKYICSIE
ncbi:MAG: biotin--[acetyl-CoA-carboxylase] ligase, partial [Oscillospiraceae bacterium]|nr:biotin--[acetyl-CoA-carboxylase] ligase [Oscillospiraceae bacterium]